MNKYLKKPTSMNIKNKNNLIISDLLDKNVGY